MNHATTLLVTAFLALLPSVVHGQDEQNAPDAPAAHSGGHTLEFEFTAGAWIPRLGGDMTLGPGGTELHLEDDLNLEDSDASFNGELLLRVDDRWLVRASGFQFSTDTRGTFFGTAQVGGLTLSTGDLFTADLDMTSFAIEGGLELFRPFPDERRYPPDAAEIRVSAVVAARYLEVEQNVEQIGVGRESPDGDWIGILGGVEADLRFKLPDSFPLGQTLRLETGVAVGADVEEWGLMIQVRAGVTLDVHESFGVMVGYRLLEVDVTDGHYELDGGLQGLFLAGTLRF